MIPIEAGIFGSSGISAPFVLITITGRLDEVNGCDCAWIGCEQKNTATPNITGKKDLLIAGYISFIKHVLDLVPGFIDLFKKITKSV
jgi:hypothetical protein